MSLSDFKLAMSGKKRTAEDRKLNVRCQEMPAATGVDNKTTSFPGRKKLFQDWLSHHLGESSTTFDANFRVSMTGKI